MTALIVAVEQGFPLPDIARTRAVTEGHSEPAAAAEREPETAAKIVLQGKERSVQMETRVEVHHQRALPA
jgi:hypothetical protein